MGTVSLKAGSIGVVGTSATGASGGVWTGETVDGMGGAGIVEKSTAGAVAGGTGRIGVGTAKDGIFMVGLVGSGSEEEAGAAALAEGTAGAAGVIEGLISDLSADASVGDETVAGAAWGFLAALALARTCFKYSLGSVSFTPPFSAGGGGTVAPAGAGAAIERGVLTCGVVAETPEGADSLDAVSAPVGASIFFIFNNFSNSSRLMFFILAIRDLASSTMAPVSWIRTNFSYSATAFSVIPLFS